MNKLKELRKQRKMTQASLAEIIGVDQSTISKWEQNKALPDVKTLTHLSYLYNVSIDSLLEKNNYGQRTMLRLKELRQKKGITQGQLANKLGLSRSTIAMYETFNSEPDLKTLTDIASFFGVSIDYLVGPVDKKPINVNKMLAKAIAESKISISRIAENSGISRQHIYKIINEEKNVSSVTLEKICKAIKVAPSSLYEGQINKSKGIKIPVLGVIPAGVPIEAVEDVLDYEEISEDMASRGEYFALKVRGDSMLPTVADGDVVIVRQQDDADSGKICVVMINGNDATLKEIKKDPEGIWVLPHNPNCSFKPTFFTNKEIIETPVRIIGVAVEIRRSL